MTTPQLVRVQVILTTDDGKSTTVLDKTHPEGFGHHLSYSSDRPVELVPSPDGKMEFRQSGPNVFKLTYSDWNSVGKILP